ncbi:2-hydroxyacyl-CoA dehydratase family protein [Clostridium gasigenes]|uniref:2-hydroxyacyl-CoA dehydratase family protein n=1 Tax=Clostridium gasigenes TaxID=94869 RepID=UPI001C0D45C6|nr:2-hydroxyacyl-CoA dehydratase family protein [Clostridium gasigenes]MBU3104228.1 2-hydroxyacyl-CoA dehydratase family protein [Clostridium gasigenes]
MSKEMGSEKLGEFYTGGKIRKRREWRGLKDTWYDYTRWLFIWRQLIGFTLKPINIKGSLRYRWMVNYLAVPDFLDRHTEGLRGPQLRIAHTEFDLIVEHMCDTLSTTFKADARLGGDKELSKKIVVFDENMMSQIMNGFPNLHMICMQLAPIYTGSTMAQDGVIHYIDVAQEYGIPGDVCPMPAAELGVAIDDDYPIIGKCAVQCNTTCDGSLMGNGLEARRFKIPTFQLAAPIRHTQEGVQEYAAEEIKNAISFIEDQTGEKFDWDNFFKCMDTFNNETKQFLEWLELSRSPYPQVIGNNVALYRCAAYQVAGGRDARFLEAEEKITKLAMEGYEKKSLCVPEVRHRAVLWGVQAQYYTAFPLWLQNCWGVLSLIDMLSLTSTRIFDIGDKNQDQALLDLAHLYMNMTMRNRSNGGYEVGLNDLWRFCDYFNADMVIMYEHIGCKAMGGYHGLFEEQARERGIHLVWVTHGLMDPRNASRRDMRTEVNRYMRSVLRAEPLDPSLEDFDDKYAF